MSERRARPRHPLRNEKGGALVMVTGFLVVILGIAALAIDVGMLFTARSEAQRAAEAGAHAGALVFLSAPGNEEGARRRAKEYAERNQVRWLDVEVDLEQDIDVEVENQLVRVRVHRSPERVGPISTFFGRILGVSEVNVAASAAARTWPADGVDCLLPFAAPDRWFDENDDPPEPGDTFNEEEGDWYDPDTTGYRMAERGTAMWLYAGDPEEAPQPSWWYPYCLPGGNCGANVMREAIQQCVSEDRYYFGDEMDVETEPGAMADPVRQGFEDLIEQDPDADWDGTLNDGNGCVTRDGETCLSPGDSPRIRPMVLFDPRQPPELGRSTFTVQNFVSVFIDEVSQGGGGQGQIEVHARFLEYTGLEPADEWHDDDSLVRMVRIVE